MKKLPLCCYLMPWENWGFYWSSDLTLIPDWKSKIVNQSGLQTNLWKIDVIPQKGELFRKKASLNDFFFKRVTISICHVTSCDHVNKRTCVFKFSNHRPCESRNMEIQRSSFVTWSPDHVIKWSRDFVGGGPSP